jgi:hypothetical protein
VSYKQMPLQSGSTVFPLIVEVREKHVEAGDNTLRSFVSHVCLFVCLFLYYLTMLSVEGASRGKGLPGWSGPPPPTNTPNRNLKNTDFVDVKISKVLRDLPFGRNQPLKSADDRYIRILKK